MTWSIVARDPDTGFFAVAIATRFFAVGAVCPWAESGAGAVSIQALINPTLGPRGLALLRQGSRAEAACDMLVRGDEGRAARQLHLVDAHGQSAAYTGEACIEWAGHPSGEAVSVAGNMLAGPAVIEDTLGTYRDDMGLPIVERLLAAMDAGQAAGGDKRGKQSAALLVQGPEPYVRLDPRVDDHGEPLAELRRLYGVARQRFVPFTRAYPTPERPCGITDRALIEKIIERDAGKSLQRAAPVPEM